LDRRLGGAHSQLDELPKIKMPTPTDVTLLFSRSSGHSFISLLRYEELTC
jgi:hypothetical protein